MKEEGFEEETASKFAIELEAYARSRQRHRDRADAAERTVERLERMYREACELIGDLLGPVVRNDVTMHLDRWTERAIEFMGAVYVSDQYTDGMGLDVERAIFHARMRDVPIRVSTETIRFTEGAAAKTDPVKCTICGAIATEVTLRTQDVEKSPGQRPERVVTGIERARCGKHK